MRRCDDWITSYLELTENTEPPELFHRWGAVSCIAACLQRKCVLPWGPLRFYPNLYIVLISPPGTARKSTALDYVMRFLEQPSLGIHLAAEAVTREQLIRELAKAQEFTTGSDGKMIGHSSMTICSGELTVFLGYNNPRLLDDLTDWYDCKRLWTYRTVHQGEYPISGVWVNLFAATTPDNLRTALPPNAIGGGLTSRIIFVYAGAKRRTIANPPYTEREQLLEEQLLFDLEEILRINGEYSATAEYAQLREEWYIQSDESPPFQDAILASYCDRRIATVTKLSIIMCASRTDTLLLEEQDFVRAVEFLEDAERLMPMALLGAGQGKYADVMSRLMAEISLRKETTLDKLMWKFRHDVSHWEMERMLASLEAMQFCVFITNTRKIMYNTEFSQR